MLYEILGHMQYMLVDFSEHLFYKILETYSDNFK